MVACTWCPGYGAPLWDDGPLAKGNDWILVFQASVVIQRMQPSLPDSSAAYTTVAVQLLHGKNTATVRKTAHVLQGQCGCQRQWNSIKVCLCLPLVAGRISPSALSRSELKSVRVFLAQRGWGRGQWCHRTKGSSALNFPHHWTCTPCTDLHCSPHAEKQTIKNNQHRNQTYSTCQYGWICFTVERVCGFPCYSMVGNWFILTW